MKVLELFVGDNNYARLLASTAPASSAVLLLGTPETPIIMLEKFVDKYSVVLKRTMQNEQPSKIREKMPLRLQSWFRSDKN